jgi:hypothetical protein
MITTNKYKIFQKAKITDKMESRYIYGLYKKVSKFINNQLYQ